MVAKTWSKLGRGLTGRERSLVTIPGGVMYLVIKTGCRRMESWATVAGNIVAKMGMEQLITRSNKRS